jgi:hypothetical protein
MHCSVPCVIQNNDSKGPNGLTVDRPLLGNSQEWVKSLNLLWNEVTEYKPFMPYNHYSMADQMRVLLDFVKHYNQLNFQNCSQDSIEIADFNNLKYVIVSLIEASSAGYLIFLANQPIDYSDSLMIDLWCQQEQNDEFMGRLKNFDEHSNDVIMASIATERAFKTWRRMMFSLPGMRNSEFIIKTMQMTTQFQKKYRQAFEMTKKLLSFNGDVSHCGVEVERQVYIFMSMFNIHVLYFEPLLESKHLLGPISKERLRCVTAWNMFRNELLKQGNKQSISGRFDQIMEHVSNHENTIQVDEELNKFKQVMDNFIINSGAILNFLLIKPIGVEDELNERQERMFFYRRDVVRLMNEFLDHVVVSLHTYLEKNIYQKERSEQITLHASDVVVLKMVRELYTNMMILVLVGQSEYPLFKVFEDPVFIETDKLLL